LCSVDLHVGYLRPCRGPTGVPRSQKSASPYMKDPTVGLCLGPCSRPIGGAVSYERGTPVGGGAAPHARGTHVVHYSIPTFKRPHAPAVKRKTRIHFHPPPSATELMATSTRALSAYHGCGVNMVSLRTLVTSEVTLFAALKSCRRVSGLGFEVFGVSRFRVICRNRGSGSGSGSGSGLGVRCSRRGARGEWLGLGVRV